jgi:putative aldouronate transport system substrate-binding protein
MQSDLPEYPTTQCEGATYMKKNWTILSAVLLTGSLLLSACGAGGQKAGEAQPPAGNSTAVQSTAASAPVKIKVFATANTDVDLTTNTFTKLAEQKFNIKFEWQSVPHEGANEKRQIALASGDFPDLFLTIPWVTGFSQTEMLKYSKQGVFLPLNDLINQYAPNIKAAFDKYPLYKAANTAPDGEIYGLSQFNECYHCSYGNKLWINNDWLKKLNLEMPKTTDEIKKVLQAFKTKDPNGNGKQDEIPISGTGDANGTSLIPYLMNGFVYDDGNNRLFVNSGKVESSAIKPEWKEGLAYIKSLFDEKLIDTGAFSQNGEALWKIGNNADAPILGAAAALHPYVFIHVAENLNSKNIEPVPPLKGPHAQYATYYPPYGSTAAFVLTNKASKEAQIAAIKMLDYLYTEEGLLQAVFGQEGAGWRKPKDGDVALNKEVKAIFAQIPGKAGDKPRNDAWGALSQYFQPKTFRDGEVQGTDIYGPTGYERRLLEATNLYNGKQPKEVYPYDAVWIDPSVVDELAMLQKNIKDYINQNALQFIMGNKDLNKDWDAYVAGLEKLNLKRYLEIMQKAYDGFKK